MTYEYSLKSLNFFAFMKPNKHKMRSKGFFHNLAGFVFEYFCDSRRILATFAKFCLNSLFATWSYRFTRHPACTRSSSPPSPTQVSWCKKFLQNPPPSLNCYQCYGLNLLPIQIFLNWFIFFKLVHIFQTSLYFSNWFNLSNWFIFLWIL